MKYIRWIKNHYRDDSLFMIGAALSLLGLFILMFCLETPDRDDVEAQKTAWCLEHSFVGYRRLDEYPVHYCVTNNGELVLVDIQD